MKKHTLSQRKSHNLSVKDVPATVLNAWQNRRSRGDVAKLVVYTGFSKPIIIQALNHGLANQSLVLKIRRYFSKKVLKTPDEVEQMAMKLLNQRA